MELKRVHIKKQEVIGTLNGRDVILVETHGGLAMVAAHKGGRLVTIGCGPLASVAKFLAEKREPDIQWSEQIMKSESDKELVCPLCHQLDRPEDCMCLYRDGFVPAKPFKF
jgi:hypothetical protein